MQTGIFFEDTIYFSGTAQEDVGNIKLIEEYIVSMATIVDSNRWFRRSASSVCSTQSASWQRLVLAHWFHPYDWALSSLLVLCYCLDTVMKKWYCPWEVLHLCCFKYFLSFFEQTVMLAFSSPLVFAQQDHLPLKKNMEYVKWLVPIMPGWRSPVYLLIRRSSWRMVTLLPTRPN